VELGAGTE